MGSKMRTFCAACACAAGLVAPGAAVAAPAPGFSIASVARPTNFSSSDNERCGAEVLVEVNEPHCDTYMVTVTNVGGGEVSAAEAEAHPITIMDTVPAGLKVAAVHTSSPEDAGGIVVNEGGVEWGKAERAEPAGFPCTRTATTVECAYEQALPPEDVLQVEIEVLVTTSEADATVTNEARVQGGGVPVAVTTADAALTAGTGPNVLNGPPTPFGVQDFNMTVNGDSGPVDSQAGDHPYLVTTTFDLNSIFGSGRRASEPYFPAQTVKNVIVYLPLGLVGDPDAAFQCPVHNMDNKSECRPFAKVGKASIDFEGQYSGSKYPIYNIKPEHGYPAEFGLSVASVEVMQYAGVVRTPAGYMVRVAAPGLEAGGLGAAKVAMGATLTFFGDPAEHDGEGAPSAFFANPTWCSGEPLRSKIEASSWQKPESYVSREATVYPSGVKGCNMLQFNPRIEAKPVETTRADSPSGYEVKLEAPQSPNIFPELATPDLKNATVTLPQGLSLSPSVASGPNALEGCGAEGPEGINIGSNNIGPGGQDLDDPWATELGEGHAGGNGSPYDDGLWHTAPGHCPQKSQIGTVEIKTPLLEGPLKGHVYVAQPQCGGSGQPACTPASAENGELYGIYLEAGSFENSGVIIKLKGEVHVNPTTGQITTTFKENPQLPFEELKLNLEGGQRAALANPQTCGTYTTTSDLEPWSAPESGPNATPSSQFEIGGCKSPIPFAPSFEAGTVKPLGGEYSPFTMTIKRADGEQDLAGVSMTMPPGLAGMLSTVPRCGEPQAKAGTCPEAARIGTAHVAAGAGSLPLWLEGGVYLTGPYDGDPFGLSIVVPAKAGPFNLGNEVVRAGIAVNPTTAQVSVSSESLRLIRDGVPFRIKAINVTIDRPGFMFNPTNCSQLQLTGTISGQLPDGTAGATVPVSQPFADVGCKNLPFKPTFKVTTKSKHTRKGGAYLRVQITSAFGQANLKKVHVTLPKALPSRLSTLKLACAEAQFAKDPAGCPPGSFVGAATVHTPVLASPLKGPAIFVSHGGRAFPNLDLVLQGEGVTILNEGATFISKKGITTSTFGAIPDVPVQKIDLTLPAGAHSALAGEGNFCRKPLYMPTEITGQNGAVKRQKTEMKVAGCKAKLRVLGRKLRGSHVHVRVLLPSAGKLVAFGKGLNRKVKRFGTAKAGKAVTTTVTVSDHERRVLARRRHRRFTAKIKLRFTPRHGKALSTRAKVLIG